jgi:preprotein translocase subunit SecF
MSNSITVNGKPAVKLVEKRRIAYIVCAAVILIGLLVALTAGFNKGPEFGGYSATISYGGGLTDDNFKTRSAEVKEFLHDVIDGEGKGYAVTVQRVAHQTSDTINHAVYVRFNVRTNHDVSTVETDFKTSLETALSAQFPGNPYAARVEVSHITAGTTFQPYVWVMSAIAVAAVLAFVYLGIRFDGKSAAAAAIGAVVSLLVTTALVAVCRIELSAAYVGVAAVTVGLSFILSVIYLTRLRQNRKNPAYDGVSAADMQNSVVRDVLPLAVIVAVPFVLFTIAITVAGGVAGAYLGAALFAGIIGAYAVSGFIIPALALEFSGANRIVETAVYNKPKPKKKTGRDKPVAEKPAKRAEKPEEVEEEAEEIVENINDRIEPDVVIEGGSEYARSDASAKPVEVIPEDDVTAELPELGELDDEADAVETLEADTPETETAPDAPAERESLDEAAVQEADVAPDSSAESVTDGATEDSTEDNKD